MGKDNMSNEEIIDILVYNPEYVDKLSDEQVDYLINYLKIEIKKQEQVLEQLENNVES